MLVASDIRLILNECKFLDWEFLLQFDGPRPYLQVRFQAPDSRYGGDPTHQTGRKWFLSYHMTRSEVVQTAFKAVLTAVEHEAREGFTWRDRPVFGPHIPVYKLWEICDTVDARKELKDG